MHFTLHNVWMNDELIAVCIGVVAGAVGYWVTTFWMKPLVRYLELRNRILADLVFYANVVDTEGMSARLQQRNLERSTAIRRHSSDLTACTLDLPGWYSWYLNRRGRDLDRVAQLLMGLSTTTDWDQVQKRTSSILKKLGYTGGITEIL